MRYSALIRRPVLWIPALVLIPYAVLYCLIHGEFGRWYWNYLVTFHPRMVDVLPSGGWGPLTDPPRWLSPIPEAPWMGTWEVPKLPHAAIVKLHIFSQATEKAQSKRNLIRSLSPLLNLPAKYHHLIEIKFVVGQAEGQEVSLETEQRLHGDLLRLMDLKGGENLREGKILQWMSEAVKGRPAWFVFKMDDDTVLNLPNFLDTLLALDPHKSYYLGTSLARWPGYHYHFTGILTGYSWPVLKTLAAGIENLRRLDIEWAYDDDVLMGELMFILPSKPSCNASIAYCDIHAPPPDGYLAPPPLIDPRTELIRYDFLRRAGDEKLWWVTGDIARHGWPLKSETGYRKEWERNIEGRMWSAPDWVQQLS